MLKKYRNVKGDESLVSFFLPRESKSAGNQHIYGMERLCVGFIMNSVPARKHESNNLITSCPDACESKPADTVATSLGGNGTKMGHMVASPCRSWVPSQRMNACVYISAPLPQSLG